MMIFFVDIIAMFTLNLMGLELTKRYLFEFDVSDFIVNLKACQGCQNESECYAEWSYHHADFQSSLWNNL